MGVEGRPVEHRLEQQHRPGTDPERHHERALVEADRHDLDRVEADPGREVDVEVGVVDLVQPPQQRHRVGDQMLEPDREIEKDLSPAARRASLAGLAD